MMEIFNSNGSFFDCNKSIVENLALLSAPLVLIIGIIGLRQLQIAKKSLKISSIRDAAKFTFEISEDYSEKFDAAVANVAIAFKNNNVERFDGEIIDFSMEKYNEIDENWRIDWGKKEKLVRNEVFSLTNLVEGYSILFIKKIADEDIAFNIDCYIFMDYVKICYPYIVKKNNEDRLRLHSCNAIELYMRWQHKIQELHNEKDLAEIQQKMNYRKKIKPIKPLGSE